MTNNVEPSTPCKIGNFGNHFKTRGINHIVLINENSGYSLSVPYLRFYEQRKRTIISACNAPSLPTC